MTVSMQLTKRIYAGNGLTRSWEVDFPLTEAQDLQVYLTSPAGYETRINADYELNAAMDTLTYPTIASGKPLLEPGWTITLVRRTPYTQEIDLLRQGELDAEVLEQGYDKLTLITQELAEKLDRCIQYPVSTQPENLETDTFLANILAAKQDAVEASGQAATAAQTAEQSAASATQTARTASSDIAQAKQTALSDLSAHAQALQTELSQSVSTAQAAAQSAQYYAEHTLGKQVGEIYYSQSAQAADNRGALPLFTGETISSVDTLYPEFYAWVSAHSELQISAADYETALSTYGACPKYVIDTVNKTIRLPKLVNAETVTSYPWVCAYNAAVPASTAQAAEFQTALSGKADVNLDNLSGAGKAVAAQMAMPSNQYIDLTLGISGSTYTAPADGFVALAKMTTAPLQNITIDCNNMRAFVWGSHADINIFTLLPVKKGDIYTVVYSALGTTAYFKFIYAEGAKPN